MKKTRKSMKKQAEYLSNGPKTFGIVYKDSAKVINYHDQPMYFRMFDLAKQWKDKLEPIFCDSDLEVIQFNPTAEEKRNNEIFKDLAHDLSERKKSVPKPAKKSKIKHSEWLLHLKKHQKEYKKQLKTIRRLESKRFKELNSEEMYF